ncbi:alkaline phosphatase D family protein [Dyadobacter tibetensis]|uniref:alkaline phosphatase D family protein n=1 Tax=Dyadobacter tibetensis TaxID=1211851 RepID=UPI00046E7B28|nr:alkaline phosphatase D family protein [Dyadobacter tibetensis]
MKRRKFIENTLMASAGLTFASKGLVARPRLLPVPDFVSDWNRQTDRTWVGEAYWPNRLQDWRLINGAVETVIRGKNRSLALLTHELGPAKEAFEVRMELQFIGETSPLDLAGWRLAASGPNPDYRSTAIYGKGMRIGVQADGQLVLGQKKSETKVERHELDGSLLLILTGKPIHHDLYTLHLSVQKGRKVLSEIKGFIVGNLELIGGVALLHDADTPAQQVLQPGVRFSNLEMKGRKLVGDLSRTFGPIFFAQYTLHYERIKLSAQLAPVVTALADLELQIKENDQWVTIGKSPIDPVSRVAAFSIPSWKAKEMVPYRLLLPISDKAGKTTSYFYEGSFSPAPTMDKPVKLGLFSCNCDYGFPDTDLRENILAHKMDAALFLGDQFYEASGGFGVEETNLERSVLDYLRKWYQFGWSYRDVFRHVPCISIPDDHDVYHGNVWGEGGKAALKEGAAYLRQDSGGYKMHPEWVAMVQKTQSSHLPDPYDPTPVENNIPVYFTHWNWGPLSFAIIEDRKFKSAPKRIFPEEAKIQNGFITNPDFKDESYLDAPQAELLGSRQEAFLEEWTRDWSKGARMKILLSQTNFCTIGTLPKGSVGDAMVPNLEIPRPGIYIQGDDMTRDMDSNGWPHSKRNRAVDILRRGSVMHLAGDQHLASVVRYGVDSHDDAGFAFAGPALNNIWPRRWWPQLPANHEPVSGGARNTGRFEDGFKNKITLHAVANPQQSGLKPAIIHDRATGYGMVIIDAKARDITMECWKRSANPVIDSENGQYTGWPITINQSDNDGRKVIGYLSELVVTGMEEPVVQVIYEPTGEVIYTRRITGHKFKPAVFKEGRYTLKVGDPDRDLWKEIKGLRMGKRSKKTRLRLG